MAKITITRLPNATPEYSPNQFDQMIQLLGSIANTSKNPPPVAIGNRVIDELGSALEGIVPKAFLNEEVDIDAVKKD